MFVHNKHVAKIYNSFIEGKIVEIGSFYNNISSNRKKKKKEILFISSYKPKSHKKVNVYIIKNIRERERFDHDFF